MFKECFWFTCLSTVIPSYLALGTVMNFKLLEINDGLNSFFWHFLFSIFSYLLYVNKSLELAL